MTHINPLPLLIALILLSNTALASEDVIQQQLSEYQSHGAKAFDAQRGAVLWRQSHQQIKLGKAVNCASCHSTRLQDAGQHMRTGKRIEPMAPSANADRFNDPKTIEKWFKRNCKWTWGRECTAQEKGDILTFLKAQ
ncbi:DUF1924 domain-containing protein [Mariprofundus ferrooxydans]|nr:DUF1924 domain-containing protein [Mariprofundus ferrooxydans]